MRMHAVEQATSDYVKHSQAEPPRALRDYANGFAVAALRSMPSQHPKDDPTLLVSMYLSIALQNHGVFALTEGCGGPCIVQAYSKPVSLCGGMRKSHRFGSH